MKLRLFGLSSILGIFFSLLSSFSAAAVGYDLNSLSQSTFLYNVYNPQYVSDFSTSEVFSTSFYNNQSIPFIMMDWEQARRDDNIIGENAPRCDWDDFRCEGSKRLWAYDLNFAFPSINLQDFVQSRIYLVFTSEGPMSSWYQAGAVPTISVSGTTGDDTYTHNFTNDIYIYWSDGSTTNNSIYSNINYACSSELTGFTNVNNNETSDIVSCSNYNADLNNSGSYSPFAYLDNTDYEYMVFYYELTNIGFNELLTYSENHNNVIPISFRVINSFVNYSNSYNNSLITTNQSSLLTGNSIALNGSYLVFSENFKFNEDTFKDENGSTSYLKYHEVDYNELKETSFENNLIHLFDFTAINPFAGIFGMFSSGGCASIPTLAGWINSPTSQVCPWFPASVSSVLTPVFEIAAVMLIFGFFVRWLSSSSGNLFEDTSHEEVSNQGGKWGHFKRGGN